nr:hypothetical protein [Tanacetum cinerariifolium]
VYPLIALLMVNANALNRSIRFDNPVRDCDDISSTKAVLMANLSSRDSDVLFEIPYSDTYLNDMINQDVQEMSYSEQTHIVDFLDNEKTNDSNIIPYS